MRGASRSHVVPPSKPPTITKDSAVSSVPSRHHLHHTREPAVKNAAVPSSKHVKQPAVKKPISKEDEELLVIARRVRRLHYKRLAIRVVAHWKLFAHYALLALRARKHHAQRAQERAWRAWCVYHSYRKRAQRSELVSLIQFKYALQRKCWSAWWRWVLACRARSVLWSFAVRQVATSVKRRAFLTWLAETRKRTAAEDTRYSRARTHYAHRLLRGYMEAWKAHHAEWKKHWIALLHHHTQLERSALRAWHQVVALRVRVRDMQRMAVLRTARGLVHNAFNAWRGYVRLRGIIAGGDEAALQQSRLGLLKRFFGTWSRRYGELQQERWMWIQAVVYYESKLKDKALTSFRHNAISRQSKHTAANMADYFHKRKLTLRYLNMWVGKWEGNLQQRKAQKNEKALHHYYRVAMRNTWNAWIVHHKRKVTSKGPLRRANILYKKRILGKVLLAWWRRTQYKQAVLQQGTKLQSRHYSHLALHAFTFWYSSTLRKQTRNTQGALATNHYARALMRRTLRTLHDIAQRSAAWQKTRFAAVRMQYLALLRVTMGGWKQYMGLCHEKNLVWQSAANLHAKGVRRKCMEVWMDYVSHRRVVRLLYIKATRHWRKQLVVRVVRAWKGQVEKWVHRRYLLSRSARHLMASIKRKHFQHWRLFAVTHAAHSQYKRAMYLRALVHMSKLLQKRIFSQWVEIHHHLKVCKIANQQARAHRKRYLLSRGFAQFQRYATACKEYKAMRSRAVRFWKQRTYANTMVAWCEWVAEHRRIRTESALAVRHWSIRVKWNAWVAWRAYTQKKRVGLMHKAMDMYKSHVTKAAATHWLKIGFATRTARMQQGMQREAQYAISLFNLVEKFARRWRSIVARRKRERTQRILASSMAQKSNSMPQREGVVESSAELPPHKPPTTEKGSQTGSLSRSSSLSQQPLLPNFQLPKSNEPPPMRTFSPSNFTPPIYPSSNTLRPANPQHSNAPFLASLPPLHHTSPFPSHSHVMDSIHAEIGQIEHELVKFAQLKMTLVEYKKHHSLWVLELQQLEAKEFTKKQALESTASQPVGEVDGASFSTAEPTPPANSELDNQGIEVAVAEEAPETLVQEAKESPKFEGDPAVAEPKEPPTLEELEEIEKKQHCILQITTLEQQIQEATELKKHQLPHIKQLHAKIIHLRQLLQQ